MALNFPAKIYQILENESADIIRWLPNGGAFRIVDHVRFEREIIPKYFRHNQISSVQRQLNLYGFKCVSRGEDKGAFFHPKFRRGDWEIVKKITRYAPIKRPDDLADPTRPDDLTVQQDPTTVQVETSSNNSSANSSSAVSSTSTPAPQAQLEPQAFYQHHISAHAFQAYANTYHRPYDPFGYNEIPPFAPPAPTMRAEPAHAMYPTSHRPPAWAWNGGPIPPHYANTYLMRQPMEPQQHASTPDHTIHQTHAVTVSKPEVHMQKTFTSTETQSKSMDISLSTNSSVCSEVSSKTAECATEPAKSLKKTSSYLNVVHDVVVIDPDFDLEAEFDFFNDVVPAMKEASSPVAKSTQPIAMKQSPAPRTSEIGINTIISQATSSAPINFFSEF